MKGNSSGRASERNSASRAHSSRRRVRGLFIESIGYFDVKRITQEAIRVIDGSIQIGSISFPRNIRKIVLVSVGKAAIPMCEGAVAALLPIVGSTLSLVGLVSGPGDRHNLPESITYFDGSHPFPNATSRRAADAAIRLLECLDEKALVIFLISGGASSMMESPLSPMVSNDQIKEFYRALVHSGLSISAMNALRKHFSKVKGGRLASMAAPAFQYSLIVSDVPGDVYDMVGSGPSLPDSSTISDCRQILTDKTVRALFSSEALEILEGPALPETPSASHPTFANSSWRCLLSNQVLLDRVAKLASNAGFHTEIDVTCDDWDYREAATYLIEKAIALREKHDRVCLISGGELSVKIEEPTGVGGRNQHFALHCAVNLLQADHRIVVLSAGSDGVDGNSPAAGAVADSSTVDRAQHLGLNPIHALQHFDSYSIFERLGDAIFTGHTGNNLRDVRIILSG